MKKNVKLFAVLLTLIMALGLLSACGGAPKQSDPVESETPTGPTAEALDRAELGIPNEYTKVKTFFGSYGFGDAEITAAMNEDESAFYLQFVCFDEDQIVVGTVNNGIVMVTYDKTGFMSGDAQLLFEDALKAEEEWHPLTGEGPDAPTATPTAEALDRAELGIPNEYTKVKTFFGSYGFGDAEITAAMNEEESAFYLQFVCFDESQIVVGTVNNGIVMVTYDKSGFMSGDAQLLFEDALKAEDEWHPLTGEGPSAAEPVNRADYNIPEQYTKVKTFFGSYGFGDAEIQAAMNEDETAFYLQFVCFDEDQIVEGTVANGIVMVTYDKTGFMSSDAQLLFEDALNAAEAWSPLQ